MEDKVILYGASGHAKVIIDLLEQNQTPIAMIIDDNPKVNLIMGNTVLLASAFDLATLENVILSIGNNKVRQLLSEKMTSAFATAIHPKAIISPHATIGVGTVIMAGAIVNPATTIGTHCIINTGAVLEHDCIIHNFVHVSPKGSLAGNVEVGEGSHIGIGATIIQGVTIGKWVLVGAGAVIINDVPDYAVVVGNPGRIIKYSNTLSNKYNLG